MQKDNSFWNTIERPIIGLSPMDGVTDAAMRFIAKKYGLADILYTEFVSAEGLWRIKKRGELDNKIWQDLRFDKTQGPNIVQLFGSEPESFYESAKIVCELGFDGIDINMGCPSPGLERRGGGAGLIRDKCNAVEVVEATRRGVSDFFDSKSAESSTHAYLSRDARMDMLRAVSAKTSASAEIDDASAPQSKTQKIKNSKTQNEEIPVSLKTRIGSERPDPKWWEVIAGMKMPAVAMHGRTFKQLYSGDADWEVLLQAAEVIRESGALFLGNGDIAGIDFFDSKSTESSTHAYLSRDARMDMLRAVSAKTSASAEIDGCTDSQKFIIESKNGRLVDLSGKMDGVLIGRGAIGNPWILRHCELRSTEAISESGIAASPLAPRNDEVDTRERLKVAVEHARKFEEVLPEQKFFVMRKHLVGYANGFPNAVELRKKLVMTNSADEVEKEINEWLQKNES